VTFLRSCVHPRVHDLCPALWVTGRKVGTQVLGFSLDVIDNNLWEAYENTCKSAVCLETPSFCKSFVDFMLTNLHSNFFHHHVSVKNGANR